MKIEINQKKNISISLIFCALVALALSAFNATMARSFQMTLGQQDSTTKTSQNSLEVAGPPPIYISINPKVKRTVTGDPIDVNIRIEKKPGVEFKEVNYPQPWGDWVVVSCQKGKFVKNPISGNLERTDHLKIFTDLDGMVEIPNLKVKFIEPGKAESEFISSVSEIQVQPKVDKKGQLKLAYHDIKGPVWLFSIEQVLLALLIALLILVLLAWFSKKMGIIKIGKALEAIRPPEEIARENLARLKNMNLIEQGLFKAYYIELTDILRRYLEGRFSVSALDRTTPELTKCLKSLLDRYDLAVIRDFLERSDMVKFAKASPEMNEIEKDWEMVRDFVEKTTAIYLETIAKEKNEAKNEKQLNASGGKP